MMQNLPLETSSKPPDIKKARSTLADVAARVGVSPVTVSNVLNGRRKNSPHQKVIMEAVSELNYHADPHAQRLASGFSPRTLGLLSTSIDLGVGTLILRGIQCAVHAHGFNMPLDVQDHAQDDQENAQVKTVRRLCRQQPRAIVTQLPLLPEALEELNFYQQAGGTLIGYGEANANIDCDQVCFDREENSYQAALALIRQGHKEIGFRSQGFPTQETARMHGFRRALAEYNLEYREEWMFVGPLYEEGGARLAHEFLNMSDRPTGLCIVNDNAAWVFVNEMVRAGVRVPEDVSVVGHDDMPAARYCIVPLSTARYPVPEIIDAVVELLLSRLDGSFTGPSRTVSLRGEIIKRDSVTKPRA